MTILSSLWKILITPPDRLEGVEQRANSRLLSALLITFFPVGIFVSTIPYSFGVEFSLSNDIDFIVLVGSSVFWLTAYGINRSGYFKASIAFTIAISLLTIFTDVILDSDLADLTYLLLPLLILGAFFSLKYVLFTLGLNIIGILLLPFLFPGNE